MQRQIIPLLARNSLSLVLALGLLVPGALAAGGDATATTTLAIKGMTCGGCVAAVKLQLKKTEGVVAYEVSLEKAEAEVNYNAAQTTPEKIAESVSKTGFEASVKKQGSDKGNQAAKRPRRGRAER